MSLSCLTGRPFTITRIRAGRKSPGLKPQHLLSVYAAAGITGAALAGAALDSTEVTFRPGALKPGRHIFDVASQKASAGSAPLVFQTIALPLFFADKESRIVIRGGTHVEWSPPADFLAEVFLNAISGMGLSADIKNPVKGYYPIGGGELEASITPAGLPLKPLKINDRGKLNTLSVKSVVSNLPLQIADRQLHGALGLLGGFQNYLSEAVLETPSPGKGTYVFILAEFENIRAGFSALGAIGKRAEEVGAEAASKFIEYINSRGALDRHLSDQLLPYMALAEDTSETTVEAVTGHILTNTYAIERFLPVKFRIDGRLGESGKITVDGCGSKRGAN